MPHCRLRARPPRHNPIRPRRTSPPASAAKAHGRAAAGRPETGPPTPRRQYRRLSRLPPLIRACGSTDRLAPVDRSSLLSGSRSERASRPAPAAAPHRIEPSVTTHKSTSVQQPAASITLREQRQRSAQRGDFSGRSLARQGGVAAAKRQREGASAAERRGRPREPACPLLPCQPWPPWPLPPRTLATPRAGVPAARAEPFRRPGGTRGQRPSSGSQRCLGLVWLAGGTGGGLPAAPVTSPAESAHPNRAYSLII